MEVVEKVLSCCSVDDADFEHDAVLYFRKQDWLWSWRVERVQIHDINMRRAVYAFLYALRSSELHHGTSSDTAYLGTCQVSFESCLQQVKNFFKSRGGRDP